MTIELLTSKMLMKCEMLNQIKSKWEEYVSAHLLHSQINDDKNHNGKCYLHENRLISSFYVTIDKRLHEYSVAAIVQNPIPL